MEVKTLLKLDSNISSLIEKGDPPASFQRTKPSPKSEIETNRNVKEASLRQDSDSSLHESELVQLPQESVKSVAEPDTLRDKKIKSSLKYTKIDDKMWPEEVENISLVESAEPIPSI